MERSFTNRVLGGVCGGLGSTLRLNPWLLRLTWVILTIISAGYAALFYILSWLLIPLESLVEPGRGRGGNLLLFLVLLLVFAGLWLGQVLGLLQLAGGESLFVPILLFVIGGGLLLREVRAR